MASSSKIFVIIGAKGGLGAEIVKRLAEKSPDEVSEIRCLVRNPSAVPSDLLPTQDERVKVMHGDATKASTLKKPFKDAQAVFFAAQGQKYKGICEVDRDSCQIVADVALEQGVPRVLLVSSMLTDPRNRFALTRMILNSPIITGFSGFCHRKGMMDLKFQGENLLRQSGQPYTIVRPGHLINGKLGQAQILAGQTDFFSWRCEIYTG
uniref:NAD(P)-binding domain-containing protein n=1 Tax=Aplanochytrium stocchinoi TaxID=215587 RepID=A0A7S3LSC9_9STRA